MKTPIPQRLTPWFAVLLMTLSFSPACVLDADDDADVEQIETDEDEDDAEVETEVEVEDEETP